jgi:hypothetical protein
VCCVEKAKKDGNGVVWCGVLFDIVQAPATMILFDTILIFCPLHDLMGNSIGFRWFCLSTITDQRLACYSCVGI